MNNLLNDENIFQLRKLLPFKTILEDHKEYEQSSQAPSAHQISQKLSNISKFCFSMSKFSH